MPTPRSSWLFVRANESVRVVLYGQGIVVLSVYGPGPARAVYAFEDEARSQDFLVKLEKKLLRTGWAFQGLNAERRNEMERRANPRTSFDRRRRW
jgi:hypothetical protein